MSALYYLDISRKVLSETLDGSSVSFPDAIAGGEMFFGVRTVQRRDGVARTCSLDVIDVYAGTGALDLRPESGSTRLKVGPGEAVEGVNLTGEIPAPVTAEALEAAIGALSGVPGAEIREKDGTFFAEFEGGEEWSIVDVENELFPRSLLRFASYESGGDWVHVLRFIQAPAAFSTAVRVLVPERPRIEDERIQVGSGDPAIDEIQVLVRPSEFIGNYQFRRSGLVSVPLSRADGIKEIAASLAPLADVGGWFEVRLSKRDEVWIYFRGTMGGTPQDKLEILVPRAPGGDYWLALDFGSPEFFGLLRAADGVSVPFHLKLLYRDASDGVSVHSVDVLATLTARRPVHWSGLEVAANIKFLSKGGDTYAPQPDGQVITGNQHTIAPFPDSAMPGGVSFVFTHPLESQDGHVSIRRNVSPGGRALVHGRDYEFEFDNNSQFTITLIPGGYFADPIIPADAPGKFELSTGVRIDALAALSGTYTTAGERSAYSAHGHAQEQIEGLVELLAAYGADIEAIKKALSLRAPVREDESTAAGVVWSLDLDPVQLVYPVSDARRSQITDWPVRVKDLLSARLSYVDFPVLSAPPSGSLLPAVTSANVTGIGTRFSDPPPEVPTGSSGIVFRNNNATEIRIPSKGNRPAHTVPPLGFVAWNGRAWYGVSKQAYAGEGEPGRDTYYADQFVFELFRFPVPSSAFELNRIFEVFFSIEVALLRANTTAQMVLEVEIGRAVEDTSPGDPGENIDRVSWDDVVSREVVRLGKQPVSAQSGVKIERAADTDAASGEVYRVSALKYGRTETSEKAIDPGFYLRGVLRNFDVTDSETDPRGYVVVSGLTLAADFESVIPAAKFGVATISD